MDLGFITYVLGNGDHIQLDKREVKMFGLRRALEKAGVEMLTARVDVVQSGEKVGTLPADFDPRKIQSTSFLYDLRPGDFTYDPTQVVWRADPSLGPGDLGAVPGFRFERAKQIREIDGPVSYSFEEESDSDA